MTISSRTPEGLPHLCPLCGQLAVVEPSYPGGDATCPSCGELLWWFRDRLGTELRLDSVFTEEGLASLDIVELVMEMEEEFGVIIPDEEAQEIRTLADAIRIIQRYRREKESN